MALFVMNGYGECYTDLTTYSTFTEAFPCDSEGQAFALVFSLASRTTFDRLEVFRQTMLRVKRRPPFFILVGNKVDKGAEREVSRKEGEDLAEMFGCEYIEMSAKTAQHVERMFFNLVRKLRGVYPPVRRMEERKHKPCIVM